METVDIFMAMKVLSTKAGLIVLVVTIGVLTLATRTYNKLVFNYAVNEAKYKWVKMGGVIAVDGRYYVLDISTYTTSPIQLKLLREIWGD